MAGNSNLIIFFLGFGSRIASQRPVVESSTSPNVIDEFETSTSQLTYPGIGDYKTPQPGFEFNIPTRAPIQGTSGNTLENLFSNSVVLFYSAHFH